MAEPRAPRRAVRVAAFLSSALFIVVACGDKGSTNSTDIPAPNADQPAGRIVKVGFWSEPTCSGNPNNTSDFPVDYGDTLCFSWPGRSGQNSASRFVCGDQQMSYTQWTTLTCSGGRVPEGTRKMVSTVECIQGVPPTQYARILDFSGCTDP